jgi:hypothetical protein
MAKKKARKQRHHRKRRMQQALIDLRYVVYPRNKEKTFVVIKSHKIVPGKYDLNLRSMGKPFCLLTLHKSGNWSIFSYDDENVEVFRSVHDIEIINFIQTLDLLTPD